MHTNQKDVKYPENLPLKEKVVQSGRSIKWYADQIKVDRQTVSMTVNGRYKGTNIVPKLLQLLTTGTLADQAV